MAPDDPTLPPDAAQLPDTPAPETPRAPAPPTADARPASGEAELPPPDSPARETPPARASHPARGTRAWRVVRCPRWHARADAHAPQRDVYVWLSTRRATSVASRPSSSDPRTP